MTDTNYKHCYNDNEKPSYGDRVRILDMPIEEKGYYGNEKYYYDKSKEVEIGCSWGNDSTYGEMIYPWRNVIIDYLTSRDMPINQILLLQLSAIYPMENDNFIPVRNTLDRLPLVVNKKEIIEHNIKYIPYFTTKIINDIWKSGIRRLYEKDHGRIELRDANKYIEHHPDGINLVMASLNTTARLASNKLKLLDIKTFAKDSEKRRREYTDKCLKIAGGFACLGLFGIYRNAIRGSEVYKSFKLNKTRKVGLSAHSFGPKMIKVGVGSGMMVIGSCLYAAKCINETFEFTSKINKLNEKIDSVINFQYGSKEEQK